MPLNELGRILRCGSSYRHTSYGHSSDFTHAPPHPLSLGIVASGSRNLRFFRAGSPVSAGSCAWSVIASAYTSCRYALPLTFHIPNALTGHGANDHLDAATLPDRKDPRSAGTGASSSSTSTQPHLYNRHQKNDNPCSRDRFAFSGGDSLGFVRVRPRQRIIRHTTRRRFVFLLPNTTSRERISPKVAGLRSARET
jgi:hypothetical protein